MVVLEKMANTTSTGFEHTYKRLYMCAHNVFFLNVLAIFFKVTVEYLSVRNY